MNKKSFTKIRMDDPVFLGDAINLNDDSSQTLPDTSTVAWHDDENDMNSIEMPDGSNMVVDSSGMIISQR